MRLWCTARREVVPFEPGPIVTMYTCGITPYDATHLGHASTYLAFDTVQRVWLDAGYTVEYAQNVTDVDDPLLERATATGVDWRDLAEEQVELSVGAAGIDTGGDLGFGPRVRHALAARRGAPDRAGREWTRRRLPHRRQPARPRGSRRRPPPHCTGLTHHAPRCGCRAGHRPARRGRNLPARSRRP